MSVPTHFDRQDVPGAGSFDPEKLEVAPGRKRDGIEGWVPELASEQELREALEKAFDYRGDVTLTQKDGTQIEGCLGEEILGKEGNRQRGSKPSSRPRRVSFRTPLPL